jgi:wobble nucleotide-excising tRNase
MITSLQLLRNVGSFDSVSSGANIPLARLTLVYAENGRGKTTLSAILRSLATGETIPIAERRRLAAQHPPHVVLSCTGGPPAATFQNNAWNRTLPDLVVFDDVFVDQNIHSGLAVAPGHRQNLHELILGAQAVSLNRQLQQLIARIETHNAALRERAAVIPQSERDGYSVEEFCALPPRADIADAISNTERNLAAAREEEPVRNTPLFDPLVLPSFDVPAIERILVEDLPSLDASAVEQIRSHLSSLGAGGEMWVNEGMARMHTSSGSAAVCPFCAQDLGGSPVINHYRAYFSEAYENLKRRIADATNQINRTHGGDRPAAFERALRFAVERRQFWSRFVEVPEITVDTAAVVRDWQAAREGVASLLNRKQSAPLERMELGNDSRTVIAKYEERRQTLASLNASLQAVNSSIEVAKERAASADPIAIAADLSRLKAVQARHLPSIASRCNDYLAEKAAKTATEQERDQTRAALDAHRSTAFSGCQTAVNIYLQRFNAGFRLDSVTSSNTRGGPACTYNVIINNTPVPVGADSPPGEPSFRNTLSSGDRNTLALAFFFATLDQDTLLHQKIVVIDDPISSLDNHRTLTTMQEIRGLAARASQTIVLSHNKPFLCRIWEGFDSTLRAALQMVRDGSGSTLRIWEVEQDCVTEHDRRDAMLRQYLVSATGSSREVAVAIRPHLEVFLRVACPANFPPGTLLGPFLQICRLRVDRNNHILDLTTIQALGHLVEHANRFHHDTNQAWETEQINDGELQGFVRQALDFVRP